MPHSFTGDLPELPVVMAAECQVSIATSSFCHFLFPISKPIVAFTKGVRYVYPHRVKFKFKYLINVHPSQKMTMSLTYIVSRVSYSDATICGGPYTQDR